MVQPHAHNYVAFGRAMGHGPRESTCKSQELSQVVLKLFLVFVHDHWSKQSWFFVRSSHRLYLVLSSIRRH